MFDRPQSGERAILVHMTSGGPADPEELQEFQELARAAGAEVLSLVSGARRVPDPGLYIGSGKAEELKQQVASQEAQLVIFDHTLSPSQERNLERLLQCRVLDRTGLILDIFAQRARSFEGKLQVELAQLRHLSTRLVRGWTHLERQRGGIGLRGPGETQLETDRRLLMQRIDHIQARLQKVEQQREQGRKARRKAAIPTLSLVGYTNAGKSTLFNALTAAGVYAQDQLFATLDPTLRRVELGEGVQLILADTVGFVSKLPHELVAAFRATLTETLEASMLLHVVDAHSASRSEQMAAVESVLEEIGALEVPRLEVFNKIDLMADVEPRIERDAEGAPRRIWISAMSGLGIDLLRQALLELFQAERLRHRFILQPDQGAERASLYRSGQVKEDRADADGVAAIDVELDSRDYHRLLKQHPRLREAEVPVD